MTPETEQLLRRWYMGQLIVLFGAAFIQLFTFDGGVFFPVGGMQLLIWGLLAWWPAAEEDQAQWRRLRHVNYYVQTVLQFTLLPILLANLVAWLSQLSWLDEQGLIAVGMAYLMVAFVPVAVVVTKPIESVIGRIAVLITAIFSGVVSAQQTFLVLPNLHAPSVFEMVSDTGILGALGFVIAVGVLLRGWGLTGPSWRFNRQAQTSLVVGLIVVGTAFSLWNAFSAGGSWATTFTHWDFQLRSATWKMFLSGLEPGIAEEWLYRFAVLTLLLQAFRHRRYQIDWAVWLSGGLFGMWHITNVFAGQPLSATVEQIIFAATLGWFLASTYLYSGSILLPMVIHAAIDILSMMASGSQTMVKPDVFEWQTIGATVIIFVGITIYFLTGSRRQVIQVHVNQRLSAQ